MNYKGLNNPKSRLEVLRLIKILNLKDCFRESNPNLKNSPARPDFLLISDTLKYMSPTIKIKNSYWSYHMHKKNEFPKGKGYGNLTTFY